MVMAYPLLIQIDYTKAKGYYIVGDWAKSWKTSKDGKTWTYKLLPNTKWSDGQADDRRLTPRGRSTRPSSTQSGATGCAGIVGQPRKASVRAEHVRRSSSTTTRRSRMRSGSSPAFRSCRRHVWEPLEKKEKAGGALKTYRPQDKLPMVTGGAYTVKQYEKKGTTAFIPDPNYWGPKSNADAVALTYYTNSDSMIADLRNGTLDWIDQVPFNAVNAVKKGKGVKVNEWPGEEITNITWNSNFRKPKNRELLDPRVKKALSMCVNRDKMIQVVFHGYATKVESLIGHISPFENPNLGPTKYNCSAANAALDKLGYTRGSDGIRVAPATTRQVRAGRTPDALRRHHADVDRLQRQPDVRDRQGRLRKARGQGHAEGGRRFDGELRARDGLEVRRLEEHRLLEVRHRDVGLDPRSRAGLPALDRDEGLSGAPGATPAGTARPTTSSTSCRATTINPAKRRAIIYRMQKMVYDAFVYTQLTNHVALDATSTKWTGFKNQLNAYSKSYYTSPRKAG